ncbi:MAG TPA: hypothetical protein PLC97_08780 [Myxococcota bacterium]|jgi:hypothetical protein|nr:hypothetical protein [Myxococcota bacterium]
MRVSRLDKSGDWQMGQWLSGSQAIAQNVTTRLKSFKFDWYLDLDAGIDWMHLLGNKGTRSRIERDVERVTLGTAGVQKITALSAQQEGRNLTISLTYLDIYGTQQGLTVAI